MNHDFEKIRNEIYKTSYSISPLQNEITKKIFWLEALLFDTNALEGKLDIEFIKQATDVLEIHSDYQMKSSKSYITYHIPSHSVVSEDLSPTYYFMIENKDNYFFRFYSNNTIDINQKSLWDTNKTKETYTIKQCLVFLIITTSILKHLQLFNRYLLSSSRIHWYYNKPTDNVLQNIYKTNTIKEDFINIIIFTSNIMEYKKGLSLSTHANSIRSLKFLYDLNNDNRKEVALNYNDKFNNSRSNLFRAIYQTISNGESQKPVENTYNTILFYRSSLHKTIELPLRLVIVSKEEDEKLKFYPIYYKSNDYLYVLSKSRNFLFAEAETGTIVRDEILIQELLRIKPKEAI